MASKSFFIIVLAAAGIAGCSVAREVPHDEGGGSCTTCHGDAARSGAPLTQAAPQDAVHLGHVQENGVACSSCHVVPSTAGHANGQVEVAFGGLARAGGAQPLYSNGTCSGVYCHGATLRAGTATTLSWAAATLDCGSCHGVPPPAPHTAATDCSACHPGTVNPDGSLVANGLHQNGVIDGPTGGAAHAAGWGDPAQHGPAAKRDLASCQGCHGVSFDGGGGGAPSCNACHGGPAWISNCTFCHGTKLATYVDADLPKAAPPRGTNGETAATAPAVGAHQKHLAGGAIGNAIACAECHAVPTDLSHLDGSATVTFGAAAKRGGAAASWGGTTCATYCHGATLAGGTNKTPSWTGGAAEAACGTCHGAPPPAPHTASTSCGSCHTGYTATTVNATTHLNGAVDVAAQSCSSCHGAPPSTGQHQRSNHRTRSCGDCHPGYTTSSTAATTHMNGTVQVGNRITSFNTTSRTCTNSCHGSETW
jgi:predicted CxxxxCH...CXXCH cytochrome family protein